MSTYVHVHVPEYPDPGGVVECTWATGVELARAMLSGTPKMPPATGAEREALRVAGGGSDSGGANYDQLAAGMRARYGLVLPVGTVFPAAPAPGTFLGVQGSYAALPASYRRWDQTFLGGHSAVVYNLTGTLMWCDPLAPPTVRAADGTTEPWQGEPIAWGAVSAYFHALAGAHVATAHLRPPAHPTGWAITVQHGAVVGYPTVTEPSPGVFRVTPGSLVSKAYAGPTASFSCSRPVYDSVGKTTLVYVPSGLYRHWVHAAGAGISVGPS